MNFIAALRPPFTPNATTPEVPSGRYFSASATHRQLTDEQLVAGGISPEMVRLSVGIEHIDDIIADLSQALEA